jgi:ubiquinone/menaquinone biosynthesis C-methylase UbiE
MVTGSVRRFNRTAEGYLRWWAPVLRPSSIRLVDRLGHIDPGLPHGRVRDVLDLGCGTGSGLFEAAQRWPGVRLVGLDGSVGMLDVARREEGRLPESARKRIDYVQADAATVPASDAAFDVVMTCFVLQQVPDRIAVLRELHRVLRPRGILAVYGWLEEKVPFAPEFELEQALMEVGISRPVDTDVKAGHYRSMRAAADELRSVGFRRVAPRAYALDHPWSVDDFIAHRTTTREIDLFGSMDDGTRQRVVQVLRRRLNTLTPDQLVFRAPIVSIVARKG